jgi:hypothetical protein
VISRSKKADRLKDVMENQTKDAVRTGVGKSKGKNWLFGGFCL